MRRLRAPACGLAAVALFASWGMAAGADAAGVEEQRAAAELARVQKLLDGGNYPEAESAARTLVTGIEASDGPGSLEGARALDLLVESLDRQGRGSEPATGDLAERALAIKERLLGPEHPEVAKSLHNLGAVALARGDLDRARSLHERGLAIREKALGPEHRDVSNSLRLLAWLSVRTSSYPTARQLYERALAIREKAQGPEDAELTAILRGLAYLLREMGDFPGARSAAERALAISERSLGPRHPDVADALRLSGTVAFSMGEFAAARSFLDRALAIAEEALGSQARHVGAIVNDIGNLCWRTGDYACARRSFERALLIFEAKYGPEAVEVAWITGNLAMACASTDDLTEARKLYERAVTILEKAVGPDDLDVALNLDNMTPLLLQIGDYEAARTSLERSLKIREKALGPNHPYVAESLHNIGACLQNMGDYAAARTYFERALKVLELAQGPDHPDVAAVLYSLGDLALVAGDDAAARPYLERALEIQTRKVGSNDPYIAATLQALARVESRAGQYASARLLHERSIAINETNLGPDHSLVAWNLQSFAETLARAGERKKALEAALRAETISRDHLALSSSALPEREALSYAATRSSGLDLALSLMNQDAVETPDGGGSVFDALIRSRALVLDEMAARHDAVARSEDPVVARLAGELAGARETLARLVVRGASDFPPGQYRGLLDSASEAKDKAERALAEKSLAFRKKLTQRDLGLPQVTAALRSNDALLAFVHYKQYDLNPPKPGTKPAQPMPSYLAFVLLGGESQPAIVHLGPAGEIERLISQVRETIGQEARAHGRSAKRTEGSYRRAAVELRHRVWDPVVGRLGDAQRIFIVPDGALHLANFAALPVGERDYLVERGPRIHYFSAERDLIPSESARHGQGILMLGDPAFDETLMFAALRSKREPGAGLRPMASTQTFRGARSACGDFQSQQFDPLPESAREADDLVRLWKQHETEAGARSRAAATGPVVALTGAAASEAGFKQQAAGKRVLHLATHGFFLGSRCASAFDATNRAIESEPPGRVKGENPLVLAGLALAGANHRQKAGPEEEDGVLTAEEIAALDLSGVEWAVLSACDTGVGEVKAGEGVLGLRRAFQSAGVRTLIMSLWPVEDEASRQWMKNLYTGRLERHLDTVDAVHEASLAMLRWRRANGKSTHPFYWASFVAAGDWR